MVNCVVKWVSRLESITRARQLRGVAENAGKTCRLHMVTRVHAHFPGLHVVPSCNAQLVTEYVLSVPLPPLRSLPHPASPQAASDDDEAGPATGVTKEKLAAQPTADKAVPKPTPKYATPALPAGHLAKLAKEKAKVAAKAVSGLKASKKSKKK